MSEFKSQDVRFKHPDPLKPTHGFLCIVLVVTAILGSIEADMKGQLPLAEHTKVFGRAMEFLIRNGNPLQWPVTTIPKTKSLCFIGLSTASRGFACRPTLVNHDESLGLLRSYLCTPTGMRRDLKAPLKIDKAPMVVSDEYAVPYRDRIPFLYRTYQHYLE